MNVLKLKKGYQKILCLAAAAVLSCTISGTAKVQAVDTAKTEVVPVEDCQELLGVVKNNWKDDFFGRILAELGSEEINVDGNTTTVSEWFGVSKEEAEAAVSSYEALEKFLNQDAAKIYVVSEKEENKFEITAPYQTKQLIVETGELEDFFGAEKAYCCKETDESYLQFATEEDTRAAYEQLTALYGDDFCFVDAVVYVNDILMDAGSSYEAYSWGAKYMGMEALKNEAAKKKGLPTVKVAVIDTGIDKTNFMFEGRTITEDSYDIEADRYNPTDKNGHGTHVSGTIVDATPDNVEIMAVKVANGLGVSATSFMRLGIEYAVKNNASVINISMGLFDPTGRSTAMYDKAIQSAYEKNIPICVAAGNDSVDAKYAYPASNTQTFTVSALTELEKIATYSNRGSLIDFTAPGSEVLSACNGGTTVKMSGTSMASPHLAAAVAYVKMVYPKMTVPQIYNVLKSYCLDLGEKGKDDLYGWGCPVLTDLFKDAEKPEPVKVGKPTLKSLTNIKNGIEIKWNKVTGCDGYRIYRKLNGGSYQLVAKVAASKTSYVDTKPAQGKKYTYALRAYKGTTLSDLGNAVQTVRLGQPAVTKASKKNSKTITVQWKKQTGAGGYQVQYSKKSDFATASVKSAASGKTSTQISGLSKGTYYVRLRTWATAGGKKVYSVWSAKKSVKIN